MLSIVLGCRVAEENKLAPRKVPLAYWGRCR